MILEAIFDQRTTVRLLLLNSKAPIVLLKLVSLKPFQNNSYLAKLQVVLCGHGIFNSCNES